MKISQHHRVNVFGIEIDRVTLLQAVDRLDGWMAEADRSCKYVVTPNLDHAVQLQKNPSLRNAYANASMVVADGWPLVTASRLSGSPLPERVAGSDLVPALLNCANQSNHERTVFLLGAAPGVAEIAARKIEKQWPSVRVVGTDSPPMGFEHNPAANQQICERINGCRPDLLIVGFGAPKQELWLSRFHQNLSVGVAIAAGATIDFFAGRQQRAPVWVQRARLEWSHRLLTNPRRLAGRYARNAWELPRLIFRDCISRRDGLELTEQTAENKESFSKRDD